MTNLLDNIGVISSLTKFFKQSTIVLVHNLFKQRIMKLFKICGLAIVGMALIVTSCSDGEDGNDGLPGADGLACWDLNGNGTAEANEDANNDSNFNALDCQGADGSGTAGTNGLACWDLNGNGVGDAEEDINQDNNFDALDCQGATGATGATGLACWDLNGNGIGDADEDTNNDNNFDALDCQGAQGDTGPTGNANVEVHYFDLDLFEDYSILNLNLYNIVDEPSNYAYLFYLESLTEDGIFRVAVPGNIATFEAETTIVMNVATGELGIIFTDTDTGNLALIPGSPFQRLTVFTIGLPNGSKSTANVILELKEAGVDTANYNEVADYFGLN